MILIRVHEFFPLKLRIFMQPTAVGAPVVGLLLGLVVRGAAEGILVGIAEGALPFQHTNNKNAI